MNKIKKIFQTINTPSEDPTLKKYMPITFILGFCVCAAVSFILTIMNFIHDYTSMGICTSILTVGFITTILFVCFRKFSVAISLSAILVSIIFTIFAVTGGNFGFAIIWILLVPLVTMNAFGIKIGSIVSLYFQILLIVMFYTPLKQNFEGFYTKIFMERFPFAYTVGFCCAFILQYQLHASRIQLLNHEKELQDAVIAERQRVSDISMQTILSISNAVDAKDKYTQQHSIRVAQYSVMIASKLGWSDEKIEQIRQIALLHDISKISITDSILNKTENLTDKEYEIMKTHTIEGNRILKDLTLLPHVNLGAKYHHERYDGKGYPDNLKADEIPIEGRIICIADSFDAMNSNRVYRKHLSKEEILTELQNNRGSQFDPELLDLFLPIAKDILEQSQD